MAAGTLADDDPETAWWHARAARARGGRIAVVRETVGLVAYRAGEWAEAIGELRAARRMGGGPGHLAVLADCERALGHPEKAIELSRSEQATELDADARIELATVVAGARADLGQTDAGLAHLEQFDAQERARNPRLGYAYADLLDRAGRPAEALTWFIRAANADTDEDTDALERVEALAAVVGSVTGESLTDQPTGTADPEPGTAGAPLPDRDAAPDPTADVKVDATVDATVDADADVRTDGGADPGADAGAGADVTRTAPGAAAETAARSTGAAAAEDADGGSAPADADPTADNGAGDPVGAGETGPATPDPSGPAGSVSGIPQVLFSDEGQ